MKKSILWLTAILVTSCGGAPQQQPSATAPPAETATAAPPPVALSAGAENGKKVYDGTCVACHGADGHGIQNLGKPLVGSKMLDLSDKDLVAFIVKGRDGFDKENTTGIAMPPKGGNPALTEKDLADVVTYLRTLK